MQPASYFLCSLMARIMAKHLVYIHNAACMRMQTKNSDLSTWPFCLISYSVFMTFGIPAVSSPPIFQWWGHGVGAADLSSGANTLLYT